MARNKALGLGLTIVGFLVTLLAAMAFWPGAKPSPIREINTKYSVPCPYFDSNGAKVSCYAISLDESANNTRENTAFLQVPVVVFSRRLVQTNPEKEALIYIPGGPGDGDQTSVLNLEFWSHWYFESNIQQDLVIFNPRVLFGSRPWWQCQNFDQLAFDTLLSDLTYEKEQLLGYEAMQKCFEDFSLWLSKNTGGAASIGDFFSAETQADDVISILTQLDYAAWHVWGVSFGTRIALIAGHAPQVKTLILDGAYPPGQGNLMDFAESLQRIMILWEKYFSTVSVASEYDYHYASFSMLLNDALEVLSNRPIIFKSELWRENKGFYLSENELLDVSKNLRFLLTAQRLKSVMIYVLYSPQLVETFLRGLYVIVGESKSSGNDQASHMSTNDDMALIVELFLNSMLDVGFNSTMFFLAECGGKAMAPAVDMDDVLKNFTPSSFPGWKEWVRVSREYNLCDSHYFSKYNNQIGEWTYPQKPMLIFSGENDPVTPPAWGNIISEKVQPSRHIIVAGGGHGVLMAGNCDKMFWSTFLDSGDTNLIIDCHAP